MRTILAIVAVAALAVSASAAVIGPWPTDSTYMWETQPLAPYVSGAVSISGGLLSMPAPTSMTKTSWLPYGGTYAEKMAIAQLMFPLEAQPATIHAKVYDPATSGKSGWAVILQDDSGRFLDLGIRGFFASQQIIARQYDGAAWTNGPTSTRTRTGNNYYTIDLTMLPGGQVSWNLAAFENGSEWSTTGQTTVAYSSFLAVYLSTATPDTSGAAAYKWTEFNYTPVPEPSGLAVLLGAAPMALVAIRRRR